jgi:hypothetical protein
MHLVQYKVKSFIPKAELAELMALFAERGELPGTVAHYVAVDGSSGWVVIDSDDLSAMYANTLAYQPWLDMSDTVVQTVDDAVPAIMEALA